MVMFLLLYFISQHVLLSCRDSHMYDKAEEEESQPAQCLHTVGLGVEVLQETVFILLTCCTYVQN
jgi:hypothetical protein